MTNRFLCYHWWKSERVPCNFSVEVFGMAKPESDPVNNGGHIAHTGQRFLSLNDEGLKYDYLDFDASNKYKVYSNTRYTPKLIGKVVHEMPVEAGIIEAETSIIDAFFYKQTYSIQIKGMENSFLSKEGPDHIVARNDRIKHPTGASGQPYVINTALAIAKRYHQHMKYKLSFNDVSLKWGGYLDTKSDYGWDVDTKTKSNRGHATHREGKDIDINRADSSGIPFPCGEAYELHHLVRDIAGSAKSPVLKCENKKKIFVDPTNPDAIFYHLDF
ncbi:MAG: hypothetical protein ACC653_14015 [Gammaproteobacteria bacterium]